jgi:hypothetical protein
MTGMHAARITDETRDRMLETGELTGAGKAFNPSDHSLISFYEFVSLRDILPTAKQVRKSRNLLPPVRCTGKQFRHIPLEGIKALCIGGKKFSVDPKGLR